MTPGDRKGSSGISAPEHDVALSGTSGAMIRADLYQPADDRANGWAIAICPGYGSVKELMEGWGTELADRGFLALIVGYTGYGDVPRQVGRIFPTENVEDARAAVRWLRSQTTTAKVAVLGVSYGAAVALQAGAEERADAVVSVVGYGSGARHLRALRRHAEWRELLERVEADRAKRVTTGESETISLDDILLRDSEAQAWRDRVESEYPNMRFDVTIESVERLIEFEPERHLPLRSGVPFLVISAEKDSIIPAEEAESMVARANEPKRLVVLEGAEHHAVHAGEHFETCLVEIEQFLTEVRAHAEP